MGILSLVLFIPKHFHLIEQLYKCCTIEKISPCNLHEERFNPQFFLLTRLKKIIVEYYSYHFSTYYFLVNFKSGAIIIDYLISIAFPSHLKVGAVACKHLIGGYL